MQTDNMKTSSSLKDTQRERVHLNYTNVTLKNSHCGGTEA